jgi:hypothetical protein
MSSKLCKTLNVCDSDAFLLQEAEEEDPPMKIHKKSAPKEEAEGEDENLECRDCGAEFVFSAGEQAFYKEKGFDNKPTRCAECKAAKKARFDDGGGGGGGGRGGRGGRGGFGGAVQFCSLLCPLQLFESTILFAPTQRFSDSVLPLVSPPVQEGRGGRGGGDRGGGRGGEPTLQSYPFLSIHVIVWYHPCNLFAFTGPCG